MSSRRLLTVIAAATGLALFAYAVRRAGVGEIVDGVRRVGWGLAVILALAGLRFAVRAQCWRLCAAPPHLRPTAPAHPRVSSPSNFTFAQAFLAFIAGDAIGSVTPLGLLASEPTKVFLTRHHFATRESVSSLALENLVYGVSVLAMVAFGLVVMLWTVPIPGVWRGAAVATLVAMAGGVLALQRALRGTWDEARGQRPAWRNRLAGIREELTRSAAGYQRRLWRVFVLDLTFHALAVSEIYLTLLWLLGDRSPTLVQAIVFEALNRVVTVVFKFVPFRVGVDEALTGALAPVLALNPAAGVTLAVVRKVRSLFWSAIGLIVVAAHPGRRGELAN